MPAGSSDSPHPKRDHVRAPRDNALSCKGWAQEAALRMLMNTLDPEVAEFPDEMIACGTNGNPAQDWPSYLAIAAALKTLENDQTLFVQSGSVAEIMRTNGAAPRVVISGDASAAGWMYVGTQGALPETYEAFRAAAQQHFGGDLAGRLVVSAGMGSLGGAQPLAAQLNGAAFLGIDADPARIKRRVKGGYCDVMVSSLDEALRILKNAVRQRAARSVGLVGNAADVLTELSERGVVPDLLTVLTSAQVRAMVQLQRLGANLLDFGSGIFARSREAGVAEPNFAAERDAARSGGLAPMRWIALSGEPSDIDRIDRLVLELFSGDEPLGRFIRLAQKHVRAQGLPARVCNMARADIATFAIAVNELVAGGQLKGPIVLGRDFVDCGATASSEKSPAAGDNELSPPMQATLKAAGGAAWALIPERAAIAGAPQRFGAAFVADGTPEAVAGIERVASP